MVAAAFRFLRLGAVLLTSGLLGSAGGARTRRKHPADSLAVAQEPPQAVQKFIAGIPVLNYNLRARSSQEVGASELPEEEDWVIVVRPDADMDALCKRSKKRACKFAGNPRKGGVPVLQVRGTESDLQGMLVGSAEVVKFVEPDLPVAMIPDLVEAGQAAATAQDLPWGLERIGAAERPRGGKGVHLFLLDTGVRTTHADFGGRAVPTLDATSGSPVECEPGDASCAQDRQGHGTHCAGTAGGATYGVAPHATIHSVKVLGDEGSGTWGMTVAALDWVATEGERPAVASMSLGSYGQIESMREAVDVAAAAGVVVVVAGGNSNDDACDYSPAFIPSAITVGSTTKSDTRSTFSNFGACTNIWAPGSLILSAGIASDTDSETLSGTSMACPHVAGGAAILLEGSPLLSSAEVLQLMVENAVSNGIEGLFASDTNELLYVGAGGPPSTEAPAPTPPPLTCPDLSTGPDSDGDCQCIGGYECWWGDYSGCPYSISEESGLYSRFYFSPSCATCQCWSMR